MGGGKGNPLAWTTANRRDNSLTWGSLAGLTTFLGDIVEAEDATAQVEGVLIHLQFSAKILRDLAFDGLADFWVSTMPGSRKIQRCLEALYGETFTRPMTSLTANVFANNSRTMAQRVSFARAFNIRMQGSESKHATPGGLAVGRVLSSLSMKLPFARAYLAVMGGMKMKRAVWLIPGCGVCRRVFTFPMRWE